MSKEKDENQYAKVVWLAGDVQSLRPEWSEDQCKQWLAENEGTIQDRMVEIGWEVIEDLLGYDDDEDEYEEDEDEEDDYYPN